MVRLLSVLVLSFSATAFAGTDNELKKKPIATDTGKVGQLLQQWWKEGTASGNAGDFYDNRDGDHSPLDLKRYPQLSAIKYSEEDIKLRRHWAAARVVLPHVTFGNSSTSAPAHLGGSNPRSYYVSQNGLSFLYNQYTKNNIYMYPEHRDHDPGHNGVFFVNGSRDEGYGDMYPTNTPCLIISQGSSGSDQPYMRTMPHVLAAFRPEVKKKLTETGLLMPTIQMLVRSTNKHLKDPKDYLTGKAHPTVFEGSTLDELAMVQKAHEMELKALPPMVQLRVVEEDKAVNGIDFFDRAPSEILGDTPACIARVHRSKAYQRRLVVSAEGSFDVNKAKLTYTWVILRGDPDKIKIVPKKEDQSVAEITVAWHERRPVSPGSALESNRVDIGVFVHNGAYYSAPGFVTICTLDREARRYNEKGVLLDIGHGMGETERRVNDWQKMLNHVSKDETAGLLLKLNEDQKGVLVHLADVHQKRVDAINEATAQVKKGEEEVKAAKEPAAVDKAKKDLEASRQRLEAARKASNDLLNRKIDPLRDSIRGFIESRLARLTQDPLFFQTQQDWLKKSRTPANEARIKSLWRKLEQFGIANDKQTLTPLLPGKTVAESNWTPFERAHLEWVHSSIIADLAFPGLIEVIWRTNYVDHRLSAPREWRDVYRYDPKGEFIGWMRYSNDGVQVFNHEGLLAMERDPQGRVVKGRVVRYAQAPDKGKFINQNPLRLVLDDTIVRYEFDGNDDWRGRRAGTEPAKEEKK